MRQAYISLSFSITKSVMTKHPVDVTSPHIARGCQPMLQLHYHRRSDGWTALYATSVVGCVGGGGTGRRACGRVHLPPVPARLSHHAAPPTPRAVATHGGLSGAGTRTDGRTDGRPGKRRRSLITGVRLHTNMTLLQYYEQSHAVTK